MLIMNITLSAEEQCIRRSREYAKKHGTSLNQLIRDYLNALIDNNNNREDVADEFSRLAMAYGGCSSEGYVFDREEAHQRGE
jgi:flavorubredoxin